MWPRRDKISSASAILGFAAFVALALAAIAIVVGRDDLADAKKVGVGAEPSTAMEQGVEGRLKRFDADDGQRSDHPMIGSGASCRVAGTIGNGTAVRVRVHVFAAELGVEARVFAGGHAFSADLPAEGSFVATAIADDGRTVEAGGFCRGSALPSLQLQFPDVDANMALVSGQCVYLETGAPVADAMVRAAQGSVLDGSPFGGSSAPGLGFDRVLWSSVTDGEGHFRARVRLGAYAVTCLKDMDEGVPAAVFVSARASPSLILFVEARASVAGEVRDEEGRTVAGVEVMARSARSVAQEASATTRLAAHGEDQSLTSRTSRTGDTGRFLLRGLPVGPVVVEAHSDDAFAEAQGLARAALPYTEFELVLRRSGPSISGVVRALANGKRGAEALAAGRTGEGAGEGVGAGEGAGEGPGVAGVLVSAEAMGPGRGRAPRVPIRRSATTSDEGHFFLGGLAPGKYALRAAAPGWAEARLEVDVGQSGLEVSVALERACDAELIVEPADPSLPVVVMLRRDASSGSSKATQSQPLSRELSGQTGAVLHVSDVVGTATLVARTVGSVSRTARRTSVDLCRGEPIRLVLGTSSSSSDEHEGEGDEAFDAEDQEAKDKDDDNDQAHDEKNGEVLATVVDERHAPVAGVRVYIHPGDYAAQTDDQGRAQFKDVVPGRYRALADGSNEAKGFSVAAGARVEVALTVQGAEGEIRGTVTAMGIPVEGAKILGACASNGAMPDLENARVEARTDSAGSFHFESTGGAFCTVRAEHPTKGRSEAVTLKAGALSAWIELQAMASIEGRVLLRGGEKPAVPASLTLTTRGRASSLEVRTVYVDDPSGAFRIDGLQPGTISVAATTESGQGHLDVSVGGGEVRRGVDVFVFGSGVVTGRVVYMLETPGGGAPTRRRIEKARVSVVAIDGGEVVDSTRLGRMATGPDGRFQLTVPAGRLLRVYASSTGFYPQGSEPFDLGVSDAPTDLGDIVLTARSGPAEKEGGVGVMIGQDPRGARVIQFTDVSPGRDAGLEVGDIIVSVDGEAVSRQPIINWVVALRGPIGTKVVLGVERGSGQTLTIVVVRGNVGLKEVPALLE
ncbi:MAG: PDZ domain-containing protein [Deltaproteobacteria bacterium]|nr:PDZ domain-containing protein [Deltaproteobacteria bacterium]